jgi:photosystem II stability/assembly factor-like uncharacterized protein
MKKMKFIVLIAVAMLTFGTNSNRAQDHEYWHNIKSPTKEMLTELYFIDSLHGWAAGNYGTLIKTTDAGYSWELMDSGTDLNIVGIYFHDTLNGWALSWKTDTAPLGTYLMKTTDGGENWTQDLFRYENAFLIDISFLDSLNGFIGGSNGDVFYTTDGGNFWERAVISDSGFCSYFPMFNFTMYDSLYGFINGGYIDISGTIWRTFDGGRTWTGQCVSPEPLHDLVFLDSLNILGVGGDFEYGTGVVRSSNGGDTWEYESLNLFGVAFAIDFRTPNEAWVPMGFAHTFIYTLDTGRTWLTYPAPDSVILYNVHFSDSTRGVAVGRDGAICVYEPLPVVGIDDEETILPETVSLQQNYPNPFNPATTIKYSLPEDGYLEIKVFDALGREIAVLLNEQKSAGHYEVTFDAAGYPSGIYFYTLKSGDVHLSRKMLLLK